VTQPQEQPEQPDVQSPNVGINASGSGVAAYQIGQLNNHIHIEGLAVLHDLMQRYGVIAPGPVGPAGEIKRHLGQQSPDIWAHDVVAAQLNHLHELPEFALGDYYNDSPDEAQTLSNRVVEAARLPVAAVALLAFWGDPATDRWWIPDLERLARVPRRGGSAWLINLPLVAASMLFYAAGVAAVCAENYARVAKLFALHGEPVNIAGPQPLSRMLAPNPSVIRLTAAESHHAVSPTVAEALHLCSVVIDDAWQLFEILRLATQLMDRPQFDGAVGNYVAADRRRTATASLDQTAPLQAEATKKRILDDLVAQCHPRGLHLRAVDKVYSPGTSFRWGSPIAERVAAEVGREGSQHPLVSGLNISAERIEIALRAVSLAVGTAAVAHPANWVSGAGPEEIWLDR
jgi:hypothetical protein